MQSIVETPVGNINNHPIFAQHNAENCDRGDDLNTSRNCMPIYMDYYRENKTVQSDIQTLFKPTVSQEYSLLNCCFDTSSLTTQTYRMQPSDQSNDVDVDDDEEFNNWDSLL